MRTFVQSTNISALCLRSRNESGYIEAKVLLLCAVPNTAPTVDQRFLVLSMDGKRRNDVTGGFPLPAAYRSRGCRQAAKP